jgi:hypothetical protein
MSRNDLQRIELGSLGTHKRFGVHPLVEDEDWCFSGEPAELVNSRGANH